MHELPKIELHVHEAKKIETGCTEKIVLLILLFGLIGGFWWRFQ